MAAIVVSILLAFGLDAAWDRAQEREAETEILSQLQEEFEFNADEFYLLQRVISERATRLRALLQASESPQEWMSPDSTDVPLQALLGPASVNPGTGALQSLIASGRLELIENDDLRARLAKWGDFVRDVKETETVSNQIAITHAYPYLTKRGRFDALDLSTLAHDPEFENLVDFRLSAYSRQLMAFRVAIEALGEIRALIDEELTVR
jgi:hypothetical protein